MEKRSKTSKPQLAKETDNARNDFISPATKLLSKRREFYVELELFENEKLKFKEHEETNKIRETKIREQDAEIQEKLIKFCKFLHDNENERLKSKRRYQEELESNIRKEDELKKEEENLENEKKISEKIDKKAVKLKKYDEYLSKVITTYHEQYQSKNDLVNRHKILKDSNDKLEKERFKLEEDTEKLKKIIIEYDQETTIKLLELGNDLANLQKEIETKQNERERIEANLEGSKKNLFTENVVIGRIFMAIDNLKNRCHAFNMANKKIKKLPNMVIKKKETKSPKEKERGKKKDEQNKGDEIIEEDKLFDIGLSAEKLQDVHNNMLDYKTILNEYGDQKKDRAKKKK